jgi:hypothetical protein
VEQKLPPQQEQEQEQEREQEQEQEQELVHTPEQRAKEDKQDKHENVQPIKKEEETKLTQDKKLTEEEYWRRFWPYLPQVSKGELTSLLAELDTLYFREGGVGIPIVPIDPAARDSDSDGDNENDSESENNRSGSVTPSGLEGQEVTTPSEEEGIELCIFLRGEADSPDIPASVLPMIEDESTEGNLVSQSFHSLYTKRLFELLAYLKVHELISVTK